MPATLTSNQRRRDAFSDALLEAMETRGLTQARLGQLVNHMGQSSVSAWVNGRALPPDIETVIKLEKVLKLPAGHLCRLLGFVPVDKEPDVELDLIQAVMHDERLDDAARRAVLDLHRELVEQAKRRHPTARARKKAGRSAA